jgi:hypothetical protein
LPWMGESQLQDMEETFADESGLNRLRSNQAARVSNDATTGTNDDKTNSRDPSTLVDRLSSHM